MILQKCSNQHYSKEKNHWFLRYFQEFMVLCEELLSGKFCILVAETLARSRSNACPELCTVAADGTPPRTAAGSTAWHLPSLFPWLWVLWFGEPISGPVSFWFPSIFMSPRVYQDCCPTRQLGSLLSGQVCGLGVRGSWPHILALRLLVFCFFLLL